MSTAPSPANARFIFYHHTEGSPCSIPYRARVKALATQVHVVTGETAEVA